MRLAVIAAVVLASSPAVAETKADALFKKGKKLLADKKYAEACATFEKVDKLEPAIGAKLNVAKCFEEWGKLALAYRWYVDAERQAKDTNDKRADKIKELVEALDADVPRLTILLPDGIDAAQVTVTLDGKPVEIFGAEIRVDPGRHSIQYDIAGGKKKKKDVPSLDRGASTEVTLVDIVNREKPPEPEPEVKPLPTVVEPKPSTGNPGKQRRLAGLIVGGAGVLGLGIAGFITLDARSSYNDALDAHCMGQKDMCSDEGVQLTNDARGRGNIATGVTILGLAAIAGGVVLYVTAPKTERSTYIAPTAGRDGAGVVIGGSF